jgi:hypothetical protein
MNEMPIINFPVIYYLIRDGKVVYIGSSKHTFYNRISRHLKDKKFDKILYKKCDNTTLIDAEIEEIRKYKPEYNKNHYPTLEKISAIHGLKSKDLII